MNWQVWAVTGQPAKPSRSKTADKKNLLFFLFCKTGFVPVIARFRRQKDERWYYTLLMSTGLTFGTISAIYGYSHGIVTQGQYSFLVAVVIGSAVIPTLIAGIFFLPRHLLPESQQKIKLMPREDDSSEEG